MTITSKYPGKCTICGGRIAIGEQIEWRKGEGSSHAACAKGGPAPSAPARPRAPSKPRAPSFPRVAPEVGAVLINGRRTDRHDMRHEPGNVIHAAKVPGGGGPDGHYWTVIVSRMSAPHEDNGQFDWIEETWVRPATDVEAEPVVVARRRAEAPKTVAAYVDRVVDAGERLPELDAGTARFGATSPGVVAQAVLGERARVALVTLMEDGTIYGWHGGHYDDYRQSAWRITAPSSTLVAAVRALASKDADALAVAADACMEAR